MTPLYLKFLQHSAELSQPNPQHPIDHAAKALLDIIACCFFHEPLTVGEAMSLTEIGSPATVHRKIDELLDAKLVEHRFIGGNRRTKYLSLTPLGVSYYALLSSAMAEACVERIQS